MTPMLIDPAALMAASPDAVIVLDASGRVLYANGAMEEMIGARADEYLGSDSLDFVHPDDVMHVLSSLETVQNKPHGTPIEVRVKDLTGRWHWLEVIGRDCRAIEGIRGIVCTARDLTRRRMWEIAANDVVRFQQVVQYARAIVLCLDNEGRVASVNGAFGRLLAFDPSHVIGSKMSDFAVADQRHLLDAAVESARGGEASAVEVEMRRARGGEPLPVRFEIVSLLDDSVVEGMVVTGQDVTELRDARRRLEHLATHDSMTGLPNRELLMRRLAQRIGDGARFGLMYIDLDGFKGINDTLGHDAGDELLVYAAERLARAVSGADLVARIGGDEFVVVAAGLSTRRAGVAMAARLKKILDAPFVLRAGPACISASIGLVMSADVVGDAVAGEEAVADLIARADMDMYAAKRLSRSAVGA